MWGRKSSMISTNRLRILPVVCFSQFAVVSWPTTSCRVSLDGGLAFDESCVFIDDFAADHGEEVLAFQFPSMKRCILAL
jgi:hypothetical protein